MLIFEQASREGYFITNSCMQCLIDTFEGVERLIRGCQLTCEVGLRSTVGQQQVGVEVGRPAGHGLRDPGSVPVQVRP